MSNAGLNVLALGATGSVGRLAVVEALRRGHSVRALVRNRARARDLPGDAEVVVGDLTQPATLRDAINGVNAVVFTHGSDGAGKVGAETVDYGGVKNVLLALRGQPVRIALMTAIGVTDRVGNYNRATEAHDWKRRAERLVRASGLPYTLVRPGWFDYNGPDEHKMLFLQGDTRHAGDPSDGVIARQQIAEVLVASLSSDAAVRKTFELVATKGGAQREVEPLFGALQGDSTSSLDGILDVANMPIQEEPSTVREDLQAVQREFGKRA